VITLTLHADVKAKLHEDDFNNAFKMMTHLKELYEPSTDTEFFMLMRELLGLCYADFNTTEDYLSHLCSLNDRIIRTKVDLTPEKRALLTLTMSLPSEFEPLIQVWSLQPTPPTFDEPPASSWSTSGATARTRGWDASSGTISPCPPSHTPTAKSAASAMILQPAASALVPKSLTLSSDAGSSILSCVLSGQSRARPPPLPPPT
jgi:hypothetical protein